MLWYVIDAREGPRDQLYFFLTFFNEAAKLHTPIMERRVRANDVPWESIEINKMLEERDNIKVEAQKTRNRDLYEQYKKLKNKINSALRKAKAEYYKGLILENKNIPDQLWKAVNMIMLSNSKGDQITKLQDEEGTYEDASDVASCFNRFFSTIGSTLTSSFISQPLPLNNAYSDHDSIFYFNDITMDFTMKQLSQLNTKKSNGLDGVNGYPAISVQE